MNGQNGGGSRMAIFLAASTAVQLVMVVSGHYVEFIRMNVFALGGMGISLVFGALWALSFATGAGQGARGGALVGGVSALIGIAVSVVLGDVETLILAVGTLSSAVTGAIGGAVGGRISRSRRMTAVAQ